MTGFILALVYTGLFLFLISKINFFKSQGLSRSMLYAAFLAKVAFGFIFWAIYTYYSNYQNKADAFLYFDDGKILYSALFNQPLDYLKLLLGSTDPSLNQYLDKTGYWTREFNQGLYNETRTIIRFNAITCLFSFGYYHVHTVFMCFLSFTGLMGIYKTFLPDLTNKKNELFAAVFFLPSVLFWASGVLKEGIIVFAMGMLIYHWFKLIKEGFSIKRSIGILFFIFLLAFSKIYILLIVLPALIAHAWVTRSNNKFTLLKYLTVILLYVSAGLMLPNVNIPFMLMEKQRQSIYLSKGGTYLANNEVNRFVYIKPEIKDRIIYLKDKPGYCKIKPGVAYIDWTKDNFLDTGVIENSADTNTYWVYYDQKPAGSKIDIPILDPSVAGILKIAPAAFCISFFRPHIFEARNPLMLLSAFESSLLIICLVICLFFYTKKNENMHLLYFCLTIVIFLFVLVGITSPILGAAVRYKMPALPFLLIAFLLLLDKEQLVKRFPLLGKI